MQCIKHHSSIEKNARHPLVNSFMSSTKKYEWKIIDRGTPFSPVTNMCNLCLKEKFHILFSKDLPLLNSRSEIYSHCRHKQSVLLIPKSRKKKIGPGWATPKGLINFLIIWNMCLSNFSCYSLPEESTCVLETLSS